MFNTLLRLLAYGYLALHLWLWWQPAVQAGIYISVLLLAFACSTMMPVFFKSRLQCGLYWLALLLLPLLARLLVRLGELVFYPLPLLLAAFDLSFIPSLGLGLVLFVGNYAFRRYPSYRVFEVVVRLALLMLAFWAMGQYQLRFYTRHDYLMLFLGFYLIVEVLFLITLPSKELPARPILKPILLTVGLVVLPLFVLFPLVFKSLSAKMVQYQGGLLQPTLSSFDFTQQLPLESEVSLDNTLLLLLRTQPPLTKKELFKRYTLGGYDDKQGFYQLETAKALENIPIRPTRFELPPLPERTVLQQEVYLINLEANALIAALQVEQITPYANTEQSSFKRIYRVDSLIGAETLPLIEEERSAASWVVDDIYLKTTPNQAIEELAQQLTAGLETSLLKAQAINSFLRNNYLYSLKPGKASGSSAIEYFLFEAGKGYCSYFAYSMALMLRYVGVSTRVAVGFWADPSVEHQGYYPITSNLAHAWVEVYIEGLGWVNFDPTSEQLDPHELGSILDTTKTDNLTTLISEATQLKLQPVANEEIVVPAVTSPLASSIKVQSIWVLALSILLLLLLSLGYCLVVIYYRRQFIPNKSLSFKEQGLQEVEYCLFHCQLTNRSNNIANFLSQYSNIALLYRKALYSKHFTQEELHLLQERCAIVINNCYYNMNLVSQGLLFLSPKQFFIKREEEGC